MRSTLPKVLHPIGGVPILRRVVNALRAAGVHETVAVLGDAADQIALSLPDDVVIAIQPSPRGTGDAVRVGLSALGALPRKVLVVNGDMPLLPPQLVTRAVEQCHDSIVTIVAAAVPDARRYGRVMLDASGRARAVVEDADATPEQKRSNLINAGLYVFDARWLSSALGELRPSDSGELYLTDLVAAAAREGQPAVIVECDDPLLVEGVNSRRELAAAEVALRERVSWRHMDAGVTIIDPASTYIDETVILAADVVIHPQTFLRGSTRVDAGSEIGPGAELIDTEVGAHSRVWWSVVEGAVLGERVLVGPYFRVRPGTRLAPGVVLGSFGEVKNSSLGAGTQMHHFSYVGDADVGDEVNIGAGAITCNFDGEQKHRTTIGDGVFVGSDTMLVAPLTLGDGSATGAGAVVTKDVPPGGLVVGVPARPIQRKREGTGGGSASA